MGKPKGCKYPDCKDCKIRIYNPGPNYLEDLEANCAMGCQAAIEEREQNEYNQDEAEREMEEKMIQDLEENYNGPDSMNDLDDQPDNFGDDYNEMSPDE